MTAAAPASLSISAAISPVWAPDAFAWQSWPPKVSFEPFEAQANCASRVAGGQTIRSALSASLSAPALMPLNSAIEDDSPFIFQLPATSGRTVAAIRHSPLHHRGYQTHPGIARGCGVTPI